MALMFDDNSTRVLCLWQEEHLPNEKESECHRDVICYPVLIDCGYESTDCEESTPAKQREARHVRKPPSTLPILADIAHRPIRKPLSCSQEMSLMMLKPTFAAGPAAKPWKNLAAIYWLIVWSLMDVQPLASTAIEVEKMVTIRRPYVSANDDVTSGPKARPNADMPKDQFT